MSGLAFEVKIEELNDAGRYLAVRLSDGNGRSLSNGEVLRIVPSASVAIRSRLSWGDRVRRFGLMGIIFRTDQAREDHIARVERMYRQDVGNTDCWSFRFTGRLRMTDVELVNSQGKALQSFCADGEFDALLARNNPLADVMAATLFGRAFA